MLPTLSGYTSATSQAGGSVTINPTTNVVSGSVSVGDWIIAIATSGSTLSGTNIPSPPTGWTTIVSYAQVGSGTMCFGVWAHKRAAGETSYTWSQGTGQTANSAFRMIFISGADDVSNWVLGPFDFRQNTGTTTTNVAASITTTSANSLAVLISAERTLAAETSAQVTCTNLTKVFFENTYDNTSFVATKSISTAGSVGSSTVTYPNTHASNGIAGILGIPPLVTGLQPLAWFQTINSLPLALAQNLIARYDFGGNTNDTGGTGNNAAIVGGVTPVASRYGTSGGAYTFDGSTGYLTTTNLLQDPQNYSINAWFKTTTTGGGVLVGFANTQSTAPANYDRLVWMDTSGRMNFGIYNNGVIYITTTNTYNDGSWHMVTATMSTTLGMTLYVDGASLASNTNAVSQSYNGWWRIGSDQTGGSWPVTSGMFYAGSLDDIKIYSVTLTSAQVSTLYTV